MTTHTPKVFKLLLCMIMILQLNLRESFYSIIVTFKFGLASSTRLHFYVCQKIDLFSLSVLFFQCESCDVFKGT